MDLITSSVHCPAVSNNTCERDLGLIIDGMIIYIRNGTNANFNALQVQKRYFSTPGGAKARIPRKTETLAVYKSKILCK